MKNIILIALVVISISSCKNNKDNTSIKQVVSALDSLHLELNTIKEKSLIPGFAVSILNKDSIIFEKGYGFADIKENKKFLPKTIQPIASISKTFVGVALMKLVDQGKLDLDEKINDILPYNIVNPNYPEISITVRHLATHTSSITHNYGEMGDSYWLLEESTFKKGEIRDDHFEFLESLKGNKPITLDELIRNVCLVNGKWYLENTFTKNAPGTKYEYSNTATSVAARIVELKSNMSFADYTQKFILKPLGMNTSGWFYDDINEGLLSKPYFPDNGANPTKNTVTPRKTYQGYPEGHLISSISDLSLYLIEMINGSNGNGKILSPQSYNILFLPELSNENYNDRDDSEFSDGYNVGIFWGISGAGYICHNGGEIGVYSFMYYNPETGIGCIGMCNSRINSFGEIRSTVANYEKRLGILIRSK